MRTVLICHQDAPLAGDVLLRWMASFSDVVGVVRLREEVGRFFRRVRREYARIGALRMLDVLAFRLYYRMFLAKHDARWLDEALNAVIRRYPDPPRPIPELATPSPNTVEAGRFLQDCHPDVVIARCKIMIKPSVFSIAKTGTFVLHPGVCPEYRNSHGCFWALANDDTAKVGLSLLKINEGVDTGPIFGYFTYDFDEVHESHIRIQHRMLLENLDQIRDKLLEIYEGRAHPLDTMGRPSAVWGQPWLTRYLRWKHHARRRHRCAP